MHFNQADFEGTWSGVALRSKSGAVNDIGATGEVGEFQDTELMERCGYLREVVGAFQMPLKSVRLLRLHAGSRVKEHRDRDLGLADGEVRVHVPVATNDGVEFIVGGRQLRLGEGEAWYVDFSQAHRIENRGDEGRVHLIVDGRLNDWMAGMLRQCVEAESVEPVGVGEFRRFCAVVYEDAGLREHLMHMTDAGKLLEAAVKAGRERGFGFAAGDVESIYKRNREEWMMRGASL